MKLKRIIPIAVILITSLLLGAFLINEKDEPREKLVDGWNKLSKILDYLVALLPDRAFIHSTSDLNTTNVLIPIIAYINAHNGKFSSFEQLKRAIHFIYIASIWGRYSGQTDQKLEFDVSLVYH